jgi:hypothetical protein
MDLVRSIVAYCYRQNVRKITESIGDNWTYILGNRISRRMLLGSVKKLQVEDLLMIVAMITDTILMVGMSIISQTSSNLIDPSEHVVLDAAEIDKREYGSKWVLVVEQMQILTIWLIKYCLLLMYNRLTRYEFEPELGC